MLKIAIFTVALALMLALLLGVHPNRGAWYRVAAACGVITILSLLALFLISAAAIHASADILLTIEQAMVVSLFACLASFLIDTVRSKDWALAIVDVAMLAAVTYVFHIFHL